MPKLAITIAGVGKLSLAPSPPGTIHMSFWIGHRMMLRVPLAWHSTALHSSTAHLVRIKVRVRVRVTIVGVRVQGKGLALTPTPTLTLTLTLALTLSLVTLSLTRYKPFLDRLSLDKVENIPRYVTETAKTYS